MVSLAQNVWRRSDIGDGRCSRVDYSDNNGILCRASISVVNRQRDHMRAFR